MKVKSLFFLSFLILSLLPFAAYAATYNWYMSNSSNGNPAGNDSTGDGSQGRPWASLSKAQSAIRTLNATDTVYLFFDRGDIWTWNSAAVNKEGYKLSIAATDPIVNIDAYGTGDNPVFDGLVTNFFTVPAHNMTTGPFKWKSFFNINRDNCSIKNVEITKVYGHGIMVTSSYFTLSHNLINKFGSCSIAVGYTDSSNIEVSYNTIHTGQQLMRYGKIGENWGGGIMLALRSTNQFKYNWVHHNTIYDIAGEGIIAINSIVEYNIIGDTGSTGIDPCMYGQNAGESIIRYNLVLFSDWNTSNYTQVGTNSVSGRPVGIRIFDDAVGGDNSGADYKIYGNIIINRWYGFRFFQPYDPGNAFGNVEIYNNIVIDSVSTNYYMSHAYEATVGTFHDNSSILIGRPSSIHIIDNSSFPDAGWSIYRNHFWTTGGSPKVDSDWRMNYVIGDPKLKGALTVNWLNQTESTYFKNINPILHLNPPADSPIFGLSPVLSMDISDIIYNIDDIGVVLAPPNDFKKIAGN